jgi:hypothetical protein
MRPLGNLIWSRPSRRQVPTLTDLIAGVVVDCVRRVRDTDSRSSIIVECAKNPCRISTVENPGGAHGVARVNVVRAPRAAVADRCIATSVLLGWYNTQRDRLELDQALLLRRLALPSAHHDLELDILAARIAMAHDLLTSFAELLVEETSEAPQSPCPPDPGCDNV